MPLSDFLVGSDASWLPRNEAPKGKGGLCSEDLKDFTKDSTTYRYLPFVPNGINCCPRDGLEVISYNFTGCILATFTDKDNIPKVCHVSTSTNADCDCKELWVSIQKTMTNVVNFKPSDFIPEPKDLKGASLVGCYGLITLEGDCYAITVVQKNDSGKVVACIAKCIPIQKQPEEDKRPVSGNVLNPATNADTKANTTANTTADTTATTTADTTATTNL